MQKRSTKHSDYKPSTLYPPRRFAHQKKKRRKQERAEVVQHDIQVQESKSISHAEEQEQPAVRKQRSAWHSFLQLASALMLLGITIGIGWLLFTPAGEAYRSRTADQLIGTPNQQWAKFLIGTTETERRIKLFNSRMDSSLTE